MHLCSLSLLSHDTDTVMLQDLQEAIVSAACADRGCACSFFVYSLHLWYILACVSSILPDKVISLTWHVLCVNARSLPGRPSIIRVIREVRLVTYLQRLPACVAMSSA